MLLKCLESSSGGQKSCDSERHALSGEAEGTGLSSWRRGSWAATSLLPEDGKQEMPGSAPGTDSKGGSGRAARITLDIRKNFCIVNVVKHISWGAPHACQLSRGIQTMF